MDFYQKLSLVITTLSVLSAPIIAIFVGQLLADKSHRKKQREDLLRRLISFSHKTDGEDFLIALNEMKFQYSNSAPVLKELDFFYQALITNNEKRDEILVELLKTALADGKFYLSKDDLRKVFMVKSKEA